MRAPRLLDFERRDLHGRILAADLHGSCFDIEGGRLTAFGRDAVPGCGDFGRLGAVDLVDIDEPRPDTGDDGEYCDDQDQKHGAHGRDSWRMPGSTQLLLFGCDSGRARQVDADTSSG